ncbi:hypothetical protein CRUP_016634 [Coryphaenoides rupestris]|nr:hypothetical protein CRUP_016634 [Coryphaenoides rupestris]
MHIPPFGDQVAVAVEEVVAGLLDRKMFGSGSKRWFVKRQRRRRQQQQQHQQQKQQKPSWRSAGVRRPGDAKKSDRWAARMLEQHRERILEELDVSVVLPYLVYDRVFSLAEYKEVLGQPPGGKRAEVFLERLAAKGPAGFCSFCAVLEDVRPQLLTCFLLDGEDGAPGRGRKGGLLDSLNNSRDPHSGGQSPSSTAPLYSSAVLAGVQQQQQQQQQQGEAPAAWLASCCRAERSLQRSFQVADCHCIAGPLSIRDAPTLTPSQRGDNYPSGLASPRPPFDTPRQPGLDYRACYCSGQ